MASLTCACPQVAHQTIFFADFFDDFRPVRSYSCSNTRVTPRDALVPLFSPAGCHPEVQVHGKGRCSLLVPICSHRFLTAPCAPQCAIQAFRSVKGVESLRVYFAEQNLTYFLVFQFKAKHGAGQRSRTLRRLTVYCIDRPLSARVMLATQT